MKQIVIILMLLCSSTMSNGQNLSLIHIFRRKMNPEKIIIETEVLVKEVETTTARLYHLGGDVYFDAEKRIMLSLIHILQIVVQYLSRIIEYSSVRC